MNKKLISKYQNAGKILINEPVQDGTYVKQPRLNLQEQELLNFMQSNPTPEQVYFRDLAIKNGEFPVQQEILEEAKKDNVKNNFFRGYNNFRYSHPWAKGLNWTPIVGDVMDGISLAGDINNKNYTSAAVGLGLMALPNFIQKPLQKYGKLQNIPDDVWDDLYNKAIKNNNLEEVQQLRDLHFKAKSNSITNINIDENGQPIVWYQGTPYGGHSILDSSKQNATIGGSIAFGEKGNFLTADLNAAERYAGKGTTHHRNIHEKTIPTTFTEKLKNILGLYKESNIHPVERIQSDLQLNLKTLRDTRDRSLIHRIAQDDFDLRPKGAVYPFYINPNNLRVTDFKNNAWSNFPEDLESYYEIYTDGKNGYASKIIINKDDAYKTFEELSDIYGDTGESIKDLQSKDFENNRRSIKRFITFYNKDQNDPLLGNEIRLTEIKPPKTTNGVVTDSFNKGYDTILIKNVIDSNGGPKGVHYPINDLIARYSNQLKLANPITYDDNGKIIPLSKRDNFNNPDIRYSWIVPISLGTASYKFQKEKEKYKQGGLLITKYKSGKPIIETPRDNTNYERKTPLVKKKNNYSSYEEIVDAKVNEKLEEKKSLLKKHTRPAPVWPVGGKRKA